MQSSAAVAGRALIMLACVVGIPALALSSASWSEMLKKLQDFRWPMIFDLTSASDALSGAPSGGEAPRFASTTATAVPPRPTVAPRALDPMSAPTVALSGPTTEPTGSAILPAGYQEAGGPVPMQLPAAGGADSAKAAPVPTADPFRYVQDRLRQLGATYYLLESWGNEQQMYRFYCKMAVGGSTAYTRCFEATNANPLQAMRQVLQQVETQRAGIAN